MESKFIVKIILSFFISGVWISLATLFAERLGSKIGGLITNLPSNILISLIFIASINGIPYVEESISGIPIGMIINTLFMIVFILTIRYGLIIATLLSLIIWFISAVIAIQIGIDFLLINCLIYLCITLFAFYLLEKKFNIQSIEKSKKKYSFIQITIRAVFAGSIVASIVIISQYVNPYFIGVFSTFPAVLLSTMVILYKNQNKEFAQATGKVLILSSTNIVVYGISVYYTYPSLGIIWGTMVSFLIAFLYVWIFIPVIKRIS